MTSRPMIYIVDDEACMRTSLSRLLRLEGFDVSLFSSAERFLELKSYARPSCLLLDLHMPDIDGLQLQDICIQKGIHLPIVFLSGHGKISLTVQAMKNGAVNFLTKPFSEVELFEAVKQALEQDASAMQRDMENFHARTHFALLTDREREVLNGVISGLLNKQIAIELGITEKTVKVHRANVMMKMNATSLPHLIHLSEMAGVVASVFPGPKSN